MGAHSTVYVTRTAAQQAVLRALMVASDQQLERWLDDLMDRHLYNCLIVADDSPEAQDYLLHRIP